jgi:hypothetical protein
MKNKDKYEAIIKMFDRTKLNEFMTYLMKITTYKMTEETKKIELTKDEWYKEEVEGTTGQKVNRELILFQVNYADASENLGVDESVIKRYLKNTAESGFIEYICGGSGTGHNKIYSFGTWVRNAGRDMYTKKPIVSKSDYWCEKLSEFTATG